MLLNAVFTRQAVSTSTRKPTSRLERASTRVGHRTRRSKRGALGHSLAASQERHAEAAQRASRERYKNWEARGLFDFSDIRRAVPRPNAVPIPNRDGHRCSKPAARVGRCVQQDHHGPGLPPVLARLRVLLRREARAAARATLRRIRLADEFPPPPPRRRRGSPLSVHVDSTVFGGGGRPEFGEPVGRRRATSLYSTNAVEQDGVRYPGLYTTVRAGQRAHLAMRTGPLKAMSLTTAVEAVSPQDLTLLGRSGGDCDGSKPLPLKNIQELEKRLRDACKRGDLSRASETELRATLGHLVLARALKRRREGLESLDDAHPRGVSRHVAALLKDAVEQYKAVARMRFDDAEKDPVRSLLCPRRYLQSSPALRGRDSRNAYVSPTGAAVAPADFGVAWGLATAYELLGKRSLAAALIHRIVVISQQSYCKELCDWPSVRAIVAKSNAWLEADQSLRSGKATVAPSVLTVRITPPGTPDKLSDTMSLSGTLPKLPAIAKAASPSVAEDIERLSDSTTFGVLRYAGVRTLPHSRMRRRPGERRNAQGAR